MTEKQGDELGPWYCSCRFSVAILGFLGFMVMNAMRISMSLAIVCMVNQTAVQQDRLAVVDAENHLTPVPTNFTVEAACEGIDAQANASAIIQRDGEFNWPKPVQGLILSSFFWGYMVSQIPAGWMADRIGGRRVFGAFILLMSVATLLHPVGARMHYKVLVGLRFFAGLGAGVSYPAMHALWGQWAPPMERSKLSGISYAGSQIGNVIALPLSGLLCEYGFDGGWPSIFYVLGSLGVLWCILWLAMVGDSPKTDRRITQTERDYIVRSLRGQVSASKEHYSVPWRSILTSMPVWAIVVSNLCGDMGFYTFETCMPSYLAEVLKFDIKTNGLFSAAPYLVYWASILTAGLVSDALRSHGILSTANTRKLMEVIGKGTTAVTIVILGFLSCEHWPLAMGLLTFGVGINGFQFSAYLVNHVDIAPRYAGLLMGISNCVACLSGFVGPYMVGVITVDQTREQWQTVFYIIAAFLVFGIVWFGIFAKGEVQDWAREPENRTGSFDEENGRKAAPEEVMMLEKPPKHDNTDVQNRRETNGYRV